MTEVELPEASPARSAAESFRRSGFGVVPDVLAPTEAARLAARCTRLLDDPRAQGARHRIPGSEDRHDRLDPVIDLDRQLAELAADPGMTRLAELALGRPVELLKDKFILKPPGARGYALHQDQAYLPSGSPPATDICVVVIALDAITAEQGAIEVAPGLHDRLRTPVGEPADLEVADLEGRALEVVEMAVGDALLLHHLAPHRSGPNRSSRGRPGLFFTYTVRRDGRRREHFYAARGVRLEATAGW